jgi:hypothetical protein
MIFLWIANACADRTSCVVLHCILATSYFEVIQVTAPSRKDFSVVAHNVSKVFQIDHKMKWVV